MSLSFLSLFPFSSRVCALAPTPRRGPSHLEHGCERQGGQVGWLPAPRAQQRLLASSSHLISSHLSLGKPYQDGDQCNDLQRVQRVQRRQVWV